MTEVNRKKWFRASALLFFVVLISTQLIGLARVVVDPAEYQDFIVQDLRVEDIPDDTGVGVMVSWKPLPPEARIIEYRVYRGSTEDQLFYIGNIQINPETGFPGERVIYTDTGYNIMANVNSPRGLRLEDNQPEGSLLYQSIPRDLRLTAHKFENYSVLASIPKKELYYNARKIEIPGEEGEDSRFYAGLRDRQLQQTMLQMKADNTYYFTVVAVDQRRRLMPYAPIVAGTPRINSPEQPRRLNTVYLKDAERLQFEWLQPFVSGGIAASNFFLLNKNDVEQYEQFLEEVKMAEENRLKRLDDPDLEPYEPTVLNPARLVHSERFTQSQTAHINLKDGVLSDMEGNPVFDANSDDINDFYAVQGFSNFWGLENYGEPAEIKTANTEDLPQKPDFVVADRPNCEGDYNILYWDKPTVVLMDTSFLNQNRTRILVNYEFETNKNYKIDNIFFEIYDDEGQEITTVNEFFQNLYFTLTLPDKYGLDSPEYRIDRPINFRMHFRVSGNELPEDYVFEQQLAFDESYMSYRPRALYLDGAPVERFFYRIYKKPYSGETYSLSSRNSGIMREAEDPVRFKSNFFRPVADIIAEDQLLLFDTTINAFYDKENKRPVNTHLFYSLVERDIELKRAQVDELTDQLNQAESAEERAELEAALEQAEKEYNQLITDNENEFMVEANRQASDRARMRMIARRREREARSMQYKMLATDGRGLFVETDPYMDKDGNTYFFPTGSWFNTERTVTLFFTLLFGILVYVMVRKAKQGKEMYIRPIAGIEEIDNAIGRATEMGRPIMFNPGLDGISRVPTLAGLAILSRVAKKAAEYDTRIIVPCRDFIVTPIAQEIVKEAHYEAGRPDTFDKNSVFFLASQQFAFVAGVSGIMVREQCATAFYMGAYYAEALIMTEVGNTVGAIQIAGTDAITQVPFFITTCDYTLIGEELYGAAAYLGREPMLMATLKAVDYMKILILTCIISGTILSTVHLTFFIDLFPKQ